ncbi:MAG TPA: helicase-related protein [Candidatus Syntrophosphaera sp.]|nr:helicase-related protein [Candidatus Syntrophosphaera sp.]
MNNFITNSKESKTLSARIRELIRASEELKFLVGFFYFSGISELIDSLKENPDCILKILVGLKIDVQNYGIIEYGDSISKSHSEIPEEYLQSVVKALNTDEFDNEIFYEQVRFILRLIKDNRIIIRKTLYPNHSKLYIFNLKEEQITRNKLFITGSSNLTRAGLKSRDEFNVEISDYGVEEAEQYYDDLWKRAVSITEESDIKDKLIINVEEKTGLKSIHPFDAYMFVVKTWLDSIYKSQEEDSLEEVLLKNNYKPYKYQIDAVKQAQYIIQENGGVILADVVGLGKSIIACLIAYQLKGRGIIICPPGLIGDDAASSGWKKYKEDFGLYGWEIFSGGDLDTVLKFIENKDNIETVIIDEAHRYRNSSTESYDMLKTICRGRKVILLTATPFNNTPADILSLLSLFIVPKKSNITITSNLSDLFHFYNNLFKELAFIQKNYKSTDPKNSGDAIKKYRALFGSEEIDIQKVTARAKFLSQQIKEVLEPVTIRRNRLDLINDPDYMDEVNDLPRVDDPKECYFQLTKEQSEFYDRVIGSYFTNNPDITDKFKGPIYKPYKYEGKDKEKLTLQEQIDQLSQDNLYDILRRQMVKRFESSFGAFQKSIENIKKSYETIRTFIEKSGGSYFLNRSLINKVNYDDPNSIDEILSIYKESIVDKDDQKSKIYNVNEFTLKDEFFNDIESDINLFSRILAEIDALRLVDNDPKRQSLIEEVEKILQTHPKKGEPAPKVVIFSEYADTVNYLAPTLKSKFAEKVLVVTGSLSNTQLEKINSNFDASYREDRQENDYDILLSTDKLSEGFNLNRASTVINYDIPWNPVRVIQRVGRINRISKKVFDTLYIINFFPTEQGSDIVRSRLIAASKMYMIHETLGEDARIFDPEEEPSPAKLFAKIQTNPDKLEPESLYTKLKNKMREWEQLYPDRVKALEDMPIRLKTAKPYNSDSLNVFIRKGRLFCVSTDAINNNGNYQTLPMEKAIERIECSPETLHLPLSKDFWNNYTILKEKAGDFFYNQKGRSNVNEAFNVISDLAEDSNPKLLPWKSFLFMLKEDIANYGTLSDYTLRNISDWIKIGKDKDYDNIISELEQLSQKLGKNYLDKVKKQLKYYDQEVIVAIENQYVKK